MSFDIPVFNCILPHILLENTAGFFEFLTEVVHIRISGCLCNFGNFHRAFFQKFLSSADPDIGNVLEYRGMLYFFKYASQVGRMQLKIRSHLRTEREASV